MGLGVASEKLGRGKISWMPRAHVTSAFVSGALDFIKKAENDDQPFYLNLWPDDVHSPFDPPQELRGDGSKRELYRGVVSNMDTELGPLFDAIRNSPKLRDNTLVIFASDNGPERGAGLAGPLRGYKGELYEGGIREPFIVWGPGIIPADKKGTVNDTAVVSGVDFLPSLLNLAGVKQIPQSDGSDLSATFTGHSTQGRTKPLFWKRPPDRPGTPDEPLPDFAMRDGDWKFLMQQDGSQPQLYNLAKDVGETKNLAAQEPQVVQRLTKAILDWNQTLPVVKIPAAPTFTDATHFMLKKGETLGRFQAPFVAKKGFRVTAKFDAKKVDGKTSSGVIVAQGGVAEGFTLFVDKEGKLNFLVRANKVAATIVSPQAISGAHTAVARLSADRSMTLLLDGKVIAQGKTPKLLTSQPLDDLSVGSDTAGAVGPYESPFPFSGDIESVVVDLESPLD